MLNSIKRVFGMGYAAVENTPRRKTSSIDQRCEDLILWESKRASAISTTRDLTRNYSVAQWAIEKHLDYIASFHFRPKTSSDLVDARIISLMDWWMKAANCDISGRHNFASLIRLSERHKTVDGDILLVKQSTGELQAIEGDRIRTAAAAKLNLPEGAWVVNGVAVDVNGKTLGYCVHRRVRGDHYEFERFVSASDAILYGQFDRIDQVRGISHILSALNSFRDLLEVSDYTLMRMKIQAIFGLVFTRQDNGEGLALPTASDDEEEKTEGYASQVNLKNGNVILDLDPGDKAEWLESNHPTTQFAEFMNQTIGIALKSLGIPMSFFREDFTNWSGARQAWILYDQSATIKRGYLKDVLDNITQWKLQTWIATGLLQLPANMTIWDVKWDWVSAGVPWLNPLQETTANIAAVNSCLTSRTRICKGQGEDFDEILAELTRENEAIKQAGLNPLETPIMAPVPFSE